MKRSTKIIAAITAAILSVGVAGCSKSTDYPDFYHSDNTNSVETEEKYVVNVLSEGGMKLNGVKVSAVKNGTVVRRGISVNGKIEFGVSLGEYDLVIDEDSLPAGYYLDGETYKTNGSARDEVTLKIPSKIIEQTATASTIYSVGEIIRDFVFTDCFGKKYTLSEQFEGENAKKAVVLNFWYSECGPCGSEFPALQKAYAACNDVEVFAICSTHRGDTNEIVKDYREDKKLTMPMGVDNIGLVNNFRVGSFPTTVVIDRYGMIAYRSSGSETNANNWSSLFNDFISDNYTQKFTTDGEGNGDSSEEERVKPNVAMPDSSELLASAKVAGDNFNATFRGDENDEYSWPFVTGNDGGIDYICSSNTGIGNSYAQVFIDIEMKKDDVLSFEYKVDSEADHDYLYVLVDGDLLNGDGWSAVTEWTSANVYVADRDKTAELCFIYLKDPADPTVKEGETPCEDTAKIRNLHVTTASALTTPIDVARPCAYGYTEGQTKYDHYVNEVLGGDGYYHKDSADGAIIYITITQLSPWSDLHTGDTSTDSLGVYYNTLYMMTYRKYATQSEDTAFNVTIGNTDVTDTVVTFYYIQGVMPAPKYLIPLTPELKLWAQKFCEEYEKSNGGTAHEDEWKEFCYYYDHYGSANFDHGKDEDGKDIICYVHDDCTRGLTIRNSYTVFEKNDPELVNSEMYNEETGRNIAYIEFPLETDNGAYYKFTAKEAGVYQVRSYTRGCSSSSVAPNVYIYDAQGKRERSGNEILDFDQLDGVDYEGFNTYIVLEADETVYFRFGVERQNTGYYDVEISYLGETYEKLFICSRGMIGAWGGENGETYLAVPVELYDGYYYVRSNGNSIDLNEKVYIDMVHGSFLYSDIVIENEEGNFRSVEYYVENGYFDKLYFGDYITSIMKDYIDEAKSLDEDDPMYGLVEADEEIVNFLNEFIDFYVDGGKGDGNGWLTFACYIESFGI